MSQSEKEIHDIKAKMDSINLIAEFQDNIRKNTSLCENFDTNLKRLKDNTDERIEAISDRARELKKDIE